MNKKLRNALSWKGEPLFSIAERNHTPTFNFVSERFRNSSDLETLGFDENECIFVHEKFSWANVAAHIGLFASASDARKSGWNIQLESGFTEAFFSASNGKPLFVFILF